LHLVVCLATRSGIASRSMWRRHQLGTRTVRQKLRTVSTTRGSNVLRDEEFGPALIWRLQILSFSAKGQRNPAVEQDAALKCTPWRTNATVAMTAIAIGIPQTK
jgi:hypothetical protein